MIVKAVNVGGNTRKLLRTLEQLSGENKYSTLMRVVFARILCDFEYVTYILLWQG